MKVPIYQVDAFAGKPFQGNPAAVCLLDKWLDDEILLCIARENNLSETAFFVEKGGIYQLRWFSPKTEIDLCGHATMAAAFVIFEKLTPSRDRVRFDTTSGKLEVWREDDYFCMDFPSRPPVPCERDENIINGLGSEPSAVYSARDYVVVYDSPETVENLDPDFSLLTKGNWSGIIATAEGTDVDFVSRYFAPSEGIPEDPVTGSACCTLAPFWSERLGKNNLRSKQVSSRTGKLFCEDLGDRINIMGKAILYLEGEIQLEVES